MIFQENLLNTKNFNNNFIDLSEFNLLYIVKAVDINKITQQKIFLNQ